MLQGLSKLSEISCSKDIKRLAQADYPGSHCPLFGVLLTEGGIEDSLIIIVGTDECCYYGKNSSLKTLPGTAGKKIVSAVLDDTDVIFGSIPAFKKVFAKFMSKHHPSSVLIVTTCIIEIIGDDYDGLVAELREEYKVPIRLVHTENFKSQNHEPGFTDTLTSCEAFMQKCEVEDSVNVLGLQLTAFKGCELAQFLEKSGIKLNILLPGCKDLDLAKAPAAKVNILNNKFALPLAKIMEERFGTPYVSFSKYASPDRIYAAYVDLFEKLGLELPNGVKELYAEAKSMELKAKETLKDISIFLGYNGYDAYELAAYLTSIGMNVQLMHSSNYGDIEKVYAEHILKKCNPYIISGVNLGLMGSIYDSLKPKLYFGMENPQVLQKYGITHVNLRKLANRQGFTASIELLRTMMQCVEKEG